MFALWHKRNKKANPLTYPNDYVIISIKINGSFSNLKGARVDYLKYFWRLLAHKWYVMLECFQHGLIWQGLAHDWDKFLPSQLVPYVSFYYRGKDKEAFDAAWDCHKRRNKHHWQYWLSKDDEPCEMPYPYNLEMFCDWVGAGKARGKPSPKNDRYFEVRNFYLEKKDRMKLNEKTRKWAEEKLFGTILSN